MQAIEKYTREIEKTERMMHAATQPKEKLALHAELKRLKNEKEEAQK